MAVTTPEAKRAILGRIYAAWLERPELRLGQLLHIATRQPRETLTGVSHMRMSDGRTAYETVRTGWVQDSSCIEDEALATACERVAK